MTDTSGAFSFDAELPAAMHLTISKPGFRTDADQETENVLVEPAHTSGIVVHLMPLSTISGRVLNEDGEPLEGLTVEAVRIEIQDGRHQLRDDYSSKVTDDRGEYRLWYLSPGNYYLRVLGRRGTVNAFASGSGGVLAEAYGPLYYPASPELSGARVMHIGGGETITADFKLTPHVVRQIRGTLVNMPPQRQIVMRLVRAGDTLGNRAQVNVANGVFGVANVTPGTYVLQAYTSDTGPMFMGETEVTVGDSDLGGVTIGMSPPVDLTVHVDVPPQADGNLQGRVTGSVQAVPLDRRLLPRNFTVPYPGWQPDGSQVIKGLLPGRYELLVNIPAPWYVSSASQGDMDVLTGGFIVTAAGAPDVTAAELRVEEHWRGKSKPRMQRRGGRLRCSARLAAGRRSSCWPSRANSRIRLFCRRGITTFMSGPNRSKLLIASPRHSCLWVHTRIGLLSKKELTK